MVAQPVESNRVRVIKAELDKCAAEYQEAKQQFETARAQFEIARNKLAGVRQLANEMLTQDDYINWKFDHKEVMHAGVPVGDAIMWVLWHHAWNSAYGIIKQEQDNPYSPGMDLKGISEALEKGGFDFHTSSPLREINGALMQLKGIAKLSNGDYARGDADEIFQKMQREQREKERSE